MLFNSCTVEGANTFEAGVTGRGIWAAMDAVLSSAILIVVDLVTRDILTVKSHKWSRNRRSFVE